MDSHQRSGKRPRATTLFCVAALALAAIPTTTLGYGYDSSDILYSSKAVDQQYSSADMTAEDDIPDFNSPNSLVSDGNDYGYYAAPSSPEFGSNTWLDRHYAAIYNKDAKRLSEGNGATSGLGAAPKKHQSVDIFGLPVESNVKDGDSFYERWIETDTPPDTWEAQVLPVGLMYPSYLAGRKESRLQSIITYDEDYGTLWDVILGGRAPIFRYGTKNITNPEGWELELEGAALLRLDWERQRNLAGTDYRAGVPLVYGTKLWQFKTGYYHVSSHIGDNYLLDHFRQRRHYVRDSIMCGFSLRPTDETRLYAEVDWAFHTGETTDPFELQFGVEYTPPFDPRASTWQCRPFLASHAHLYEERDFGGYWATQTGVQWRGPTNSLLRLGVEFYVGGDDLYQFHTTYQKKIGGGIWYDF